MLQIYNENKYNFKLKENTIKNIIGRWKNISLRFTKYNAIENKFNKNNELILWDYTNTLIYTSNKKTQYFKDIITKEYYPGFYILMTNKTEILYDLIFKSGVRKMSQ